MILITSLKKQSYKNDKPTETLYNTQAWVNPDKILTIMPTKTSIYDYENGIDYQATGSKITMANGSKLTCELSPKEVIELIDSCYR